MSFPGYRDTDMALSVNQQAKYWGIAAAIFLFVLWWLGNVILPFVLGGALAYMLDPIADRFERWGFSRAMAVVTIMLTALLVIVLLFLLVIPLLVQQAGALVNTAPQMFEELQGWLTAMFPSVMDEDSTIRQQLLALGQTIQSKGGDLLNSVLSSALSLINIIVLLIIVPVVTFYLLLDWDRMIARIDDMLPRDHLAEIRKIAAEIDRTLASFIRGQGTVCLILGTYYALGLMAVGLNFGLVLGFIAGLVSFIPYVGALIGGGLALGLALFQFWGQWPWIAAVGGVFLIGQMVEGNILTPKLVGESVGLHPVWLLFALSVFGAVFGFVGLLVAVPMAAMIGVVIRYAMGQYKQGRLYQGLSGSE